MVEEGVGGHFLVDLEKGYKDRGFKKFSGGEEGNFWGLFYRVVR